jgi:hypothetical protein
MDASDPSLDLRQWVREIPDFPKPGILFRDLTPLMRDPRGWQETVHRLGLQCDRLQPDLIVGIESRGFIVGTALATALRLPFVPVRKPGKLPGEVHGIDGGGRAGADHRHQARTDPQRATRTEPARMSAKVLPKRQAAAGGGVLGQPAPLHSEAKPKGPVTARL